MAARSAYHTISLKRAFGNRPGSRTTTFFTKPKSEAKPLAKKMRLKAQRHQASMMLGGAAL
jgi:hypothetical protein